MALIGGLTESIAFLFPMSKIMFRTGGANLGVFIILHVFWKSVRFLMKLSIPQAASVAQLGARDESTWHACAVFSECESENLSGAATLCSLSQLSLKRGSLPLQLHGKRESRR